MSAKQNIVRGIALFAAALTIVTATAGTAAAANRNVLVKNSTNHTLVKLYASRTDDSNFHGDWLGNDVLEPGQSTVINFNDGTGACAFDVKGMFNDDTSVQQHNFNVCVEPVMNFTGN